MGQDIITTTPKSSASTGFQPRECCVPQGSGLPPPLERQLVENQSGISTNSAGTSMERNQQHDSGCRAKKRTHLYPGSSSSMAALTFWPVATSR